MSTHNEHEELVEDAVEDPVEEAEVEAWESEGGHPVDDERARLVAERASRREARLNALKPAPVVVHSASVAPVVAESAPVAVAFAPVAAAEVAPASEAPVRVEYVTVKKRTTDGFWGSLGLFLLRLVVAAIMGLHGVFHLLNQGPTTDMINSTVLPQASTLALVLGAAEVAIAISMVFGLLTRLSGFGVTLITGGALAFVIWGPWSPITPGQPGFTGAYELLLAAVGLMFFFVGAGGWSIDRGFRARREASKAVRG